MTILEKELEAKLVNSIEDLGGRCLKWTSPGTVGLPDRIVLLPGGVIAFVEMKRPKGSKVGPLQKYWRRVLTGLGFRYWLVYTAADIEALLDIIVRGWPD